MPLDPETAALLEVTRRHSRALSKQMRVTSQLHARLADRLDELAEANPTAQPKEGTAHEQQDST